MKTLLMIVALGLSSASALASTPALWDCSGGSIEGLSIYKSGTDLKGDLSWDCFPGDGICNQRATVERVVLNNGDQIFEGPSFKLIVHTSEAPGTDGYKAHIIATDKTDAGDEGRGLSIDQYTTCQEKQ